MLLYLCADEAELSDDGTRPTRPGPTKTKRGPRHFPADQVRPWDVGMRLGTALRRGYQAAETGRAETDPDTGRARPRPHVRRAHWHTYLTGAGRTRRVLRWVPPVGVNVETPEGLPTTVRPVR